MRRTNKLCTCNPPLKPTQQSHAEGCDYWRPPPLSKEEQREQARQKERDADAAERLLYRVLVKKETPVVIEEPGYDYEEGTHKVELYNLGSKSDGIVWYQNRARWLGDWARELSQHHRYVLRTLAARAMNVYTLSLK